MYVWKKIQQASRDNVIIKLIIPYEWKTFVLYYQNIQAAFRTEDPFSLDAVLKTLTYPKQSSILNW